jgi:chaperonin GroES
MALRLPAVAQFRPIKDTIYCQMFKQTNKLSKDSKLIIPDIAKEEVFIARVLKVGPGKTIEYFTDAGTPEGERVVRMPLDVKPQDIIVFARYHGERLEIDGAYYLILRDDDVLGIVDVPQEDIEEYLVPWTIGQKNDADLEAAKVLAHA